MASSNQKYMCYTNTFNFQKHVTEEKENVFKTCRHPEDAYICSSMVQSNGLLFGLLFLVGCTGVSPPIQVQKLTFSLGTSKS